MLLEYAAILQEIGREISEHVLNSNVAGFGIVEGVVDGGDEVEDKLTKRRSSTRVRYILTVKVNEQGKKKHDYF